MSENNSLAIFSRGALMLAEADTMQKAKELKDMALTAGEWAKRKNMGEEAILHCRSYALEAERKMGEMLVATERAKGRAGIGRPVLEASKPARVLGGYVPLPPKPKVPTLEELGLTKRESAEAQKLAQVSQEAFDALKAGSKTKVQVLNPAHVAYNSGENEWYTPGEYVAAARAAMGGIDCDPASSEVANRTVGARVYFTKEQDGLKQKWRGSVFMNPPYAGPLIGKFSEAVCAKFGAGEIEQAVVLVNNATETGWFQLLLASAAAVCLVRGRIKFIDQAGKASGAPLQGQAVLYLGKRVKAFQAAFGGMGEVLVHG